MVAKTALKRAGVPSPTRALPAKFASQTTDVREMPSYDPDDNEGPVGPEPDPFDPPACNALTADRVGAMLDLDRAQREADAPTSRSTYEQPTRVPIRAAELGDAQHDNMPDKVRETTRRVEAQERERADRGKRKREEIASTGEQMKTQATHDTYGFKVSGLGNYEQYLKRLLKSKDAAMAK